MKGVVEVQVLGGPQLEPLTYLREVLCDMLRENQHAHAKNKPDGRWHLENDILSPL